MTAGWIGRAGLALAFLACLEAGQDGAQAQSYPIKPVRLIVPFAPGGGSDFIARMVAGKLAPLLGQQVVVENRPGASGNIGAEAGVRAAPDGYTYALISAGYTVNAVLSSLRFDPVADITPISLLDKGPFIVAVHPSLPVKTAADLVALARSKPGAINYASSGQGSIIHMATELFLSMSNARMTNIPYKGTGPALVDTMAGHTQVVFGSVPSTLPFVKSGRLRGLAVTSAQRVAADRSIPTLAESGVKGYEVNNWHGLIAPKGLPRPLVERMNRDVLKVLQDKDMEDKLVVEGVAPAGTSPEAFLELIRREIETWRRVSTQAGIKMEL